MSDTMTHEESPCIPMPDRANVPPEPISSKDLDISAFPMPETQAKTSSWGGPRPGFGGPQPGSGRPRKPHQPVAAAYTPDTPRWCVLSFFGQAETSATTELTRQGYETYLPLVAVLRRDPVVTAMWHTVRVPYLPGYGFIRLTQSEPRIPVLETRGVREILRRPDGRASNVRDTEIEQMRALDEQRLQLPKERGAVLRVGTPIRVGEGPFSGHPGAVLECDGVKTRVEVEIFGRMTPVWLDRVSVEVC